jgi:hypothetical protein
MKHARTIAFFCAVTISAAAAFVGAERSSALTSAAATTCAQVTGAKWTEPTPP